jgi:hypothetical protein
MVPLNTDTTEDSPTRLPADRPAPAPPWAAIAGRLGLGPDGLGLDEFLRPVAWLGTQAVLVLHPTLALLGAGPNADRLVHYLEQLDTPPDHTREEESR